MDKLVLALRFIGIGFYIGGAIVAGLFLGLWLDGVLNTGGIWIAGLLLGIFVAFWGAYRMLIPLLDNNNKNDQGRNS